MFSPENSNFLKPLKLTEWVGSNLLNVSKIFWKDISNCKKKKKNPKKQLILTYSKQVTYISLNIINISHKYH